MAIEGVDYSWARPNLRELYRVGKRFIVRYVSHDSSGKNLTKAEADRAIAAGLAVVTNWEWDARDQLGGYARGVEHAREADQLHRAAGGPSGRPIYFSTDFDASTAQLATCHDYLHGAASIIGWDRVGVYGGYRTIGYMAGRGVRWLWQTYAWSGGQWDQRTHIQQYRNGVTLAGGEVDLNRAMKAYYGQWGQEQEDDMPYKDWPKADRDALIGDLRDALSSTVGETYHAARSGAFPVGQEIEPRAALRQSWTYGKLNHRTNRDIAAEVAAMRAEQAGQRELLMGLAAGGGLTDEQVSQLGDRIAEAGKGAAEEVLARLAAAGEALADDGDEG